MKLVDLTHSISPNMPVYPGTEQPVLTTGCSIDKDGFLEKKITFYSHTGTHIDAPAHLLKAGKTLNKLPIEHFYGPALLLNFDTVPTQTIEVKDLQSYQDKIRAVDFLLLHTGWSQYWGSDKYFANFPVLSVEAAHWLSTLGLKGIGLDTISADTADSEEFLVHKALLEKDTCIIENLSNLAALPGDQFEFSCLPLSFEDADGSPIRAVAILQ